MIVDVDGVVGSGDFSVGAIYLNAANKSAVQSPPGDVPSKAFGPLASTSSAAVQGEAGLVSSYWN